MRVTDQSMIEDSIQQIQRGQERLQDTQRKATSGIQIALPSDDPIAHAQIHAQQEQLTRLGSYNNNIGLVQSRLASTESALQGYQGVLTRLREVVMMSLNQVTTTDSVPIEAEQLYQQLVGMTNQAYGGDFLFGGFSGSAPFAGTRFVGDNQKRAVEVSPLGATLFGVSAQEAFGVTPGQEVFKDIADTVTAMRTGNHAQLAAGLDAVDKYLNLTAQSMSSLGAQQNTLSLAKSSNDQYTLTLQKAISAQRDINQAAIYSQLAADQHTVEATYAVLGNASKLSILRYL